jgi:MFS family permease
LPVSAVDCVQPALQHTREQLFTRFQFGQWSRLALVGILAAELHVGGCNTGNLNGRWPRIPQKNPSDLLPTASLPFNWPPANPAQISEHLSQFIGLILLGLAVAMVLGFVFMYINSVFRFILFDSVLHKHCSISRGWNKWHRAGGRFFLWQLVFQFAFWLFLLFLIAVPLAVVFAAGWVTNPREHIGPLALIVIMFLGAFAIFILLAAAVQVLAKDFLVPLMALDNLDFADGWHRLLAVIEPEKGRFAIYLLLKLVLSIAAAILFGLIAIVPVLFVAVPGVVAVIAGKAAGMGWNVTTVSLAIILGTMLALLLVYLIALVCVPATVFFPAYALHFFASRYPNLNALLNPAPTPPAPELPPVPQSPPPFEAPPLPPSAEPIG